MITLKQVSFSFNKNDIIFDKINLNIPENKFITIIGPSGSGKTTLAKLMSGIIAPVSGQILLDGIDTNIPENKRNFLQKPAFVGKLSEYNNVFTTTLEELTAFGPENSGIPEEEISARIDQSLQITGLEKFRFIPVYSLPRGKKQLAILASFLTLKPKYIILDEPTSLLDEKDEKIFWGIVKNIYESDKTGIIYFSNGTFVPDCGSLFYMNPRRVLSSAGIAMSKNDSLPGRQADSLGGPFNSGLFTMVNPEETPMERPKHQIKVSGSYVLLEIKDMTYSTKKTFFNDSIPILKKVNLNVSKGEFVFIQGNSGSGKSTLAKLIVKLIEPTLGEIAFPSFFPVTDKKLLTQKTGLIFQEPENQFLAENIEQEMNFGLINFNITEKERAERIQWVFDLFSLNYNDLKKQDMLYFPLAEKRKIAAAATLVLFPEILVIDDILTGLDTKEKNKFLSALFQYQKQKNSACIIFTSRKLDKNQADRYFVLEEGQLVKRGP